MKNPTNPTGLTGQIEQGCRSERPATAAAARNLPGAAWITDEAVADTIRVWAPSYGGKLTESEAVEILMNVKNLVEALIRAKRRR
jgi:hypothetical protein